MKPVVPPPPFASLLSRLVDGTLDAAGTAKLDEILCHSPEARDYYRFYLATHLGLAEVAPRMKPSSSARAWWMRHARIPLAIAALIMLAVGLAFWAPWRNARQSPAAPVLAVATIANDVRWSLPEPALAGQSLHAGRIALRAGTLALTLGGGQLVTLVGPTDFELIDQTEVFLHQGNASLRIIGDGGPCAIRVPHGTVTDLGTEFSVKVAPDGTADVWVFDGKVLVSLTSGASTRGEQPLTAGQSLRIGETLSPSPATAADFIRPLLAGVGEPQPPANVIADFSAEFPASSLGSGQPFGGSETPANGWNYLWNPTGILGTAADYESLVANTVNTFPAANGGGIFPMFTKLGDVAFNSTGQGIFRYGRIAKTSIHPGRWITGKDYRTIIAYTIQPDEAGKIHIANSSLTRHRDQGNGVDLDVFVNDTRVAALGKDGFKSLTASDFNGSLGILSAGDTVYVTLGNNGDDGHGGRDSYDDFDACIIDFQLVREP